ncbi:MAG: pantetheine-phosphate adenylyltransferase [Planctomycetota bacterium]|jgi:pantetheine-phosphate adenylyltransferase
MVRALYPGSFDPVTLGHIDLVTRALELFDEVTVAVADNITKLPLFSLAERMQMLRAVLPAADRVQVVSFRGLVVDFCQAHDHHVILRGVRTVSDFEYEYQMALTNRHLNDAVETVFVMPSVEFSFVSSSLIKDIVRNGGDVSAFVPPSVDAQMRKKLLDGQS